MAFPATAIMVAALAAQLAAARASPQGEVALPDMPWFARLGLRASDVNFRMPVADRVVLVPDEATFLDELSRWSLNARWPVLIEDDWYAPRFVRGFQPKEVVRRTSVATAMPSGEALHTAVDRAVAAAWSRPDSSTVTASAAFAAARFVPAGLVVTADDAPQRCAAAALAAWHGQPVAWLAGDFGTLGSTISESQTQALSTGVEGAARDCGYPALALGDAIETVTLALPMGIKATLPLTTQFTQVNNARSSQPAATSDAMCRLEDGTRWAVASSIVGSPAQSVAMAMSSAFLPREDALLWNGYPDTGQWQQYGFDPILPMMEESGVKPSARRGDAAEASDFRVAGVAGLTAHWLFIDSKGNWDFFDLANDSRADAMDVPLLVVPTPLYMVHSFSLQMPAYEPSIGARWLDHGVYAYVGSVQEPMLNGFTPPGLVIDRTLRLVPFLVASRWLEGPGDACWRIALIGDPLMQVRPIAKIPVAPRVAPETIPSDRRDGCQPIRAAAIQLLRRSQAPDATPDVLQAAARDMALLGDTALVCGAFAAAEKQGDPVASAVAPVALESLFLAGDHASFMRAIALVPSPSPRQLDFLWAMWTPAIGSSMDSPTVRYLASHPRQPRAQVDLSRLLPQMVRVMGPQETKNAIEAAMRACPDDGDRDKIAQLLRGV
ncbi:MAG: hypothetical protein O2819_04245 [Planctomycetota bacterium]|nr:hypothetical protein [Planctomycetota bacterium]MDA1105926.1 hypothetical protein [Planctomycetota bacterium]